jgi:hypothetical protein
MARYKVLKSVAHSIGHSFTSLMNYGGNDYVMGHLLRRARETGDEQLMVDLLTGIAGPKSLLTAEVATSIANYCQWVPRLVENHKTQMAYVRAARMSVTFDLKVRRPVRYASAFEESPYVCRVEIEDDRGKIWAAEIKDWWYPEAGTPQWNASEGRLVSIIERLDQIVRTIWPWARFVRVAT